MHRAYYNEWEPHAAQWLRNLIAAGHIAPGDVDERSIMEVKADDLRGYTQCHFFAGIGGWSLALRLAGWPDDRPVWTGSCPCQPFSNAGQRKADSDERHLWPAFYGLIRDGKPPVALGEQVASRLGREWLAGVRADLEVLGYEVGAADLCAAGVGAPQIRQRLYWVADAAHNRQPWEQGARSGRAGFTHGCRLGHANHNGCGAAGLGVAGRAEQDAEHDGGDGRLADTAGDGCEQHSLGRGRGTRGRAAMLGQRVASHGHDGGLEHAERTGLQGQPLAIVGPGRQGYWDAFDLIPCRDGKSRRVEPGTFPLAHGVPGRVGLLRGYGNAIVPQVAATFIRAAFG